MRFFPANSCIASSRIAVETLASFGVFARAVATKFVVTAGDLAYVAGLSPQEKADARVKARGFRDLADGKTDTLDTHVVVIAGDRWVLDPSFDQVARPIGIRIKPTVLVMPIEEEIKDPESIHIHAEAFDDDFREFTIRYWTLDDQRFMNTPAWETDHLEVPVRLIVQEMTNRYFNQRPPGGNTTT